ncbi:type IX secretion system outer membrane channel protein PorV [Chitinophaga horti]|uniref:Type IX secretion system outer membrane channel protein PorV n=1 Tax=Chitinophaga horti TaxID=2920382 RepID=A0ABY6J1E0_9BACT|nr:type IX secretion system outer membrane channel protein PorV [Chitinophaga horti]UYQ92129.1 type IX secretion system outer membrane channel protein PorV [Chitinophaga horti]
MKNTFHMKLAIAAMLLGAPIVGAAQEVNSIDIVTNSVPFLRISPDARAGGMGETGIATAPDAASSFYNLSKIPFLAGAKGGSLTYTPWMTNFGVDGTHLLAASAYYKLDSTQAIVAGIRYFNLGAIELTDVEGKSVGRSRPNEWSAELGYTRQLSGKLSVGVAFRYIYSNLANGAAMNGINYKAGQTVAGDLSVYYNGREEGEGWAFGAVLSNLGGKIAYTDNANQKQYIPSNLGVGASYATMLDEQQSLTIGADVNKLLVPALKGNDAASMEDYHNKGVVAGWINSFGNSAYTASLGAEYDYNKQFFARGGYFFDMKDAANRRYFTLGAGVAYSFATINLSYIIPSGTGLSRSPLANTLRVGAELKF